jgi:hypothetical protein
MHAMGCCLAGNAGEGSSSNSQENSPAALYCDCTTTASLRQAAHVTKQPTAYHLACSHRHPASQTQGPVPQLPAQALLPLLLLLQALQTLAQCCLLLLAAAECLPVPQPGPQPQQLWQRLQAPWLHPAGSHLLRRGQSLLHQCHCPQWPVGADTRKQADM